MVGIDIMLLRRGLSEISRKLTAGPGLLTQALGITPTLSGVNLQGPVLWIEDHAEIIPEDQILHSARVGLTYAGPEAATLPWRFRIQDSKWTSPAK